MFSCLLLHEFDPVDCNAWKYLHPSESYFDEIFWYFAKGCDWTLLLNKIMKHYRIICFGTFFIHALDNFLPINFPIIPQKKIPIIIFTFSTIKLVQKASKNVPKWEKILLIVSGSYFGSICNIHGLDALEYITLNMY